MLHFRSRFSSFSDKWLSLKFFVLFVQFWFFLSMFLTSVLCTILTSVLGTGDGALEAGQHPEHDDQDSGGEEDQGLAGDAGSQADQQEP